MSLKKASTLMAGFLLIAAGLLFLAVNLTSFQVDWWLVARIAVPSLLIFAGLLKLVRHFSWGEEELAQRPGKAGLLGGLFWLSLGAIVLFDILDLIETLSFVGFYWPVLLILFGVGKVVDHYRFEGRLQFRIAEIFGVVFVLTFGIACGRLADAHLPLLEEISWRTSFPLPVEMEDEKFTYESSESFELAKDGTLGINNVYGNVTVRPAVDDQVTVRLTKVIRGLGEAEARQLADEVSIVSSVEAQTLQIGTNRAELGDRGRRLITHLEILSPAGVPVRAANRYGNLVVRERSAGCVLENAYGEVRVDSVSGSVSVENQYDSVTLQKIEGEVRIQNRRGEASLEEITGNATVASDHEPISLRNIRGDVSVRNLFGTVRIQGVEGNAVVDASGSSVEASGIRGQLVVASSHKSVRIREIGGDLNLDTSYSDVRVEKVSGAVELQAVHCEVNAKQVQGGVKVQGRGSEILLSEVSGKLDIATSLRRVLVDGFSGGPIRIQNEYGSVEIRARTPLSESVKVVNKNAEIILLVPSSSAFRLSAQAVEGAIESDFGTDARLEQNEVASLETSVGVGGPEVELQTTYSRIRIRKRG